MYYFYLFFFLFFLSGLFVYIVKYKHFLLMLLSLESMVLSLYFIIMVWISHFFFESFLCIIYLIMSVCESALSLSLLVLLIRMYGNDQVMMFDNLW
uniref:NADH-ubiquinone oxidoreductase chain 4L n=1 Tax=Curculionoidea sp. 18 KM-2017 TaxID=2219401 RepID=A0A346RGN9_9CUCU|nr:NADH dehydrogenase subunit 4L [Curculionoidea sp. 18 KM-2017]